MSFIAVGVTAGLGVGQAVIGGIKASKAQKGLQNLRTPVYSPNKAISDYYQQALQRAQESPYASNYYQQAEKQAGRGLATGIGALEDRRSAVGNIGALVQGNNDSLQRAGVQAEGLQRQAFGQLGQAVNMQNADYQRQFEQNQVAPYEKQASIYQAKAVAGSQMENAGLQNAFGGLGSASQFGMLKNLYGGGNSAYPTGGGGGSSAGTSNPGVWGGGLGSALGNTGSYIASGI